MSGTGYVPLPAPVTANPEFYRQGIEGLNALRDQQAKQASADAYRQATDPATGQVDVPKFNALIARGPGAWNAGPLMRQQGEAAGAQTSAATGQFNLASSQNSAVNNAASAALGVPDDQLHATVAQQLQKLVDANMVPRDKAMAWLANLSNNPAEMRQQLKTIWAQTAPPEIGQALRFGQPFRQTGPTGATIGGTQDISTGAVSEPASQQGLAAGLDPGQQAQFQQWLQGEVEIPDPNNPGGKLKSTRLQQFQRMGVDPRLFYPGGSVGGGSGAPPSSPNASPNVRTTSASPNASPNAGRPLAAPSEADIETQKAGAGMGIALTQRAGQVPDNQANLGNMLTDANKLDSMGAGSSREAYLNSFFQKWSGSGLLGNATREQIAAAESFNKLGNIMASNQMSALGASDARQQLAIGANPHLDLSKLGNEQIIHMLQGNEDAIAAKSGAWEDWKLSHGTGSYAQFQNDLNKNFDLRVFQQQYMNKDELDALKKQLKSQGNYEEFIRKVLHARAQKWIQ